MSFSEKLQSLRERNGYTQEELAKKMNVSSQTIEKWESGESFSEVADLIKTSHLVNVIVEHLVCA